MDNAFIEIGKIINTFGIRGELKIEPYADSPEFLRGFHTFYIDGTGYAVRSCRVSGRFVVASLEGIDTIDQAETYKNRLLYIARADAHLEEGQYFIADLVGFTVLNDDTGETLGTVTEILSPPGGDVLVITGEREILSPLRPEFVVARDMEGKTLRLRLLEGM